MQLILYTTETNMEVYHQIQQFQTTHHHLEIQKENLE